MILQQQAHHDAPLQCGFIRALKKTFSPIESCMVVTMQAISGAGYPGVPSLDIIDNVVPYIGGEEEKIEWETLKTLGNIVDGDDGLKAFDIRAPATARLCVVQSRGGHRWAFDDRAGALCETPPPSPQQVREALVVYTPDALARGCPSAPVDTIVVHEESGRPQPRLDRYYQDGAGVSVGRVRQRPVLDVKFIVLANNVSIGAATSSIINAEMTSFKFPLLLEAS